MKTIFVPQFLFLQISEPCNLHCQHCLSWQNKTLPNRLSSERLHDLVNEFADYNPSGKVIISGGEPLLELERFKIVCKASRERKLRTISVSNGSLIDDTLAKQLMLEGSDELSISLDSYEPILHDRMRGTPGTFTKACAAMKSLVNARLNLGLFDRKIHAIALLMDENYQDLDKFYHLALVDLGVDKLKISLLQPTFELATNLDHIHDKFFAKHSNVDGEKLAILLRECNSKYNLHLNPLWIDQVVMYFASLKNVKPDQLMKGWSRSTMTRNHVCNSYERNIMVNSLGEARLCYSTRFPGYPLRVLGDLARFWESSDEIRLALSTCNKLCGIGQCGRRESATLKV